MITMYVILFFIITPEIRSCAVSVPDRVRADRVDPVHQHVELCQGGGGREHRHKRPIERIVHHTYLFHIWPPPPSIVRI